MFPSTQKQVTLGIVLITVGIIGLLTVSFFQPSALSMDSALNIANQYLASLNNHDLAIDEIMEFKQNFYVVYYEKSTGKGAFEMLIDKGTGQIFPEYGPNMMWNTKYGMMQGVMGHHSGMMGGPNPYPTGQMNVNQTEAVEIAQDYLNNNYLGTVASDIHTFYGYYTVHFTRNGTIDGMLSVNGYTGAVWYHDWHGPYVQSREVH